jgi:hypothetical protein
MMGMEPFFAPANPKHDLWEAHQQFIEATQNATQAIQAFSQQWEETNMSSVQEQEGAVVTEEKPETTTIGKKKTEKTGNLILDIAHEVESLTKVKALNLAENLAENIEVNYFKLGGVLKLINDNSWFEGNFQGFDEFVYEKYGFQGRKARYLISIYDNLVTKQIPWDKVSHLGWTKLKDLAPVITPENVDEWVAKAEKCTVLELQALLKAGQPSEGGEKTAKTTDEVVKMTFKLKPDQSDIVNQALAKAKGELHTEYDTVALENICAGYVGGTSQVSKPFSLDEVIQTTGFEPLLKRVSEMFPMYDITVAPVET